MDEMSGQHRFGRRSDRSELNRPIVKMIKIDAEDPAVALVKFLRKHKTKTKSKANFVSMGKGKWFIPGDKQEHFLDLYCHAMLDMPPDFELVPRVQTRKTPFVVDIDLFCKENHRTL